MDNEKFESYEDTHKKLAEAMQEACSTKEFGEYKVPYIDLSFLEYDYEFDETGEHQMPEINKKKKGIYFSRFMKVAAIIIVVLLSINIIMLSSNSTDSYGDRGIINKLVGVFSGENDYTSDDEIVKTYVITDEEELPEMIESFTELYVPNYVPYGFELKKLIVEFTESGDNRVKYRYIREKEEFSIGILYGTDLNIIKHSVDVDEQINSVDRVICVYKDVNNDGYIADIYFDDCVIDIIGLKNKNELIEVAKELKHVSN